MKNITTESMIERYGSTTLRISPKKGGPVAYVEFCSEMGCDGWSITNGSGGAIIPPIDSFEQLELLFVALDCNWRAYIPKESE